MFNRLKCIRRAKTSRRTRSTRARTFSTFVTVLEENFWARIQLNTHFPEEIARISLWLNFRWQYSLLEEFPTKKVRNVHHGSKDENLEFLLVGGDNVFFHGMCFFKYGQIALRPIGKVSIEQFACLIVSQMALTKKEARFEASTRKMSRNVSLWIT